MASRIRCTITGQFLKAGTEKRRPATTVKETVKPTCKPGNKKK